MSGFVKPFQPGGHGGNLLSSPHSSQRRLEWGTVGVTLSRFSPLSPPTQAKKRLEWGTVRLFYSPSLDHIASTLDLVLGSILSMSGQGRVKPSAGHFRVASMPILLP